MRGAMPTHWERTHTITLNTTPVPPWKIFIIIITFEGNTYVRLLR